MPDFIPLGFLPNTPGASSTAYALSSDGKTVVGANQTAAAQLPFRWTESTGMRALPILAGFDSAEPFGVSADGGAIVGVVSNRGGRGGFRYTDAGGMQLFDPRPGLVVAAFARGVSADGSVVVGAGDGSVGQEAFRWSSAGGMHGLGMLGSHGSSNAETVSADGRVVGGITSVPSGASHAFYWSGETGMIGLPPASGAVDSNGEALNDAGTLLVGNSNFAGGRTVATAWKLPQRDRLVLGNLPGGTASIAFGVSADSERIVGNDQVGQGQLAFLWEPKRGMRSLVHVLVELGLGAKLKGWTLWRAIDISSDGSRVVGTGLNPKGVDEAFLAILR